jgi:hypothetical protein
MKKTLLILVPFLGGAAFVSYFWFSFPNVPPAAEVRVELTPDRVERGKYLANHVTVCVDCHSTRDWSRFSGPIVPGSEGKGGERFDEAVGIPGVLFARNITPAHLSSWTDGEVLRAFTAGVSRDGKALFPLMPYVLYNQLTKQDADAVLAYVRTLKPIQNETSEGKLHFPMNLIVRTIPRAWRPEANPEPSNPLERGRYLTTVAGCIECHTQSEQGKRLPGMEFAGGFKFVISGGVTRSSNITPDPVTGIGGMEKASFISRFKTVQAYPVKQGEFNTPMPWTMYSGMKKEDLGAIYDYLRTVKPVVNRVERFTAGEGL